MNTIKKWALPSIVILLATIFILSFPILSIAFDCPGVDVKLLPKGYQKVTVSSTSIGLSPPFEAEIGVATLETNPVRYRDTGTAPTATDGLRMVENSSIVICEGSLRDIEFIATGADATLHILYYGR